jgi:DNA-binding CsgD family transcriptional regulator
MLPFQKINIQLENVLNSSSVSCLEKSFVELCRNYCIERFSITRLVDDDKISESFNTYPKEWINHHVENRYYENDLVFNMVTMNNLPFLWNGDKCHGLAEQQVKIYQEAQDFGIKMGFTIPLFHPKRYQSSLTILDNLHLHSEALYSLVMAAQVYLNKVHQLGCPSSSEGDCSSRLVVNDISLTPRESECLIFLMRGYTAKEVANSMNVSSRTVECHLDNIKEKTGYLTKSKIIDNLLCNAHNKPILQKALQL